MSLEDGASIYIRRVIPIKFWIEKLEGEHRETLVAVLAAERALQGLDRQRKMGEDRQQSPASGSCSAAKSSTTSSQSAASRRPLRPLKLEDAASLFLCQSLLCKIRSKSRQPPNTSRSRLTYRLHWLCHRIDSRSRRSRDSGVAFLMQDVTAQ